MQRIEAVTTAQMEKVDAQNRPEDDRDISDLPIDGVTQERQKVWRDAADKDCNSIGDNNKTQ
jgi:hypothetical protein